MYAMLLLAMLSGSGNGNGTDPKIEMDALETRIYQDGGVKAIVSFYEKSTRGAALALDVDRRFLQLYRKQKKVDKNVVAKIEATLKRAEERQEYQSKRLRFFTDILERDKKPPEKSGGSK
jgi:hypothetical protein